MTFRFLLALLLGAFTSTHAQFTEDFSGTFSSPHQWEGDTALFIINGAQELQSNGPSASSDLFLATYSNALRGASWQFSLRMDFESSASNYAQVYLAASGMDRTSPAFEAYFLKIGGQSGSKDGIDLYYQKGSNKQLLAKGLEGRAGGKTVNLRFRVTCDEEGLWQVYSDSTGGTASWLEEARIQHTADFRAQYFGIACVHSSTRRAGFFFDDLFITGGTLDTQAPQLLSQAYDRTSGRWRLLFDEALNPASFPWMEASQAPGLPLLMHCRMEGTVLWVSDSLQIVAEGKAFDVQLLGIADRFGNRAVLAVQLIRPKVPAKGDLVINEVLFDPVPYGTDFVELYNRSAEYLSYDSLQLMNAEAQKKTFSIPVAPPHSYFVLCADSLQLLNDYPSAARNVFIASALPAFGDEQGAVLLLQGKDTLDRMNYSASMHHPLLESAEGISLERTDPALSSLWPGNWQSASLSSGGATPGYVNSQYLNEVSTEKALRIEPRSIAPGTDGYRNLAVIRYALPWPAASVQLDVFSLQGRWICSLLPSGSADYRGQCIWNGTDARAQPVETGLYVVVAEFFDQEGNRKKVKDTISVLLH